MSSDEWYRPQYRGHEAELISAQEILRSTGYTRGALSKWKSRHADMPEAVCKRWSVSENRVGSHGVLETYWVRAEMEPWLAKRLEKAQQYTNPEDRDERYRSVSSRLRENDKRVAWIAEREKTLKAELEKLREEREQIQHRSVDDRRFVEAYERERELERARESSATDEEV
ncbi:hypothetical protein [Streptomyces sp. NPDC018584]|uniref:hypothetical protein n=1 Tax=unclassified Streptomyces TaxID=2593676 RepID=UPI0037AC86D4